MSKESAAAILVQTLFTADTAMQHLVTSHAKVGNAEPADVAKFIVPFYTAMLKAIENGESDESAHDAAEKTHHAIPTAGNQSAQKK
jgi:hypothetical protein